MGKQTKTYSLIIEFDGFDTLFIASPVTYAFHGALIFDSYVNHDDWYSTKTN
jgi:hypothetical protein